MSETPVDQQASAPEKVVVSMRPVGNAPQLKQRKFNVERNKTVSWVIQWLRKTIKCADSDSLFVYVSQSFAPSLDQELGTLYECHGVAGRLVLHYCMTQAWG